MKEYVNTLYCFCDKYIAVETPENDDTATQFLLENESNIVQEFLGHIVVADRAYYCFPKTTNKLVNVVAMISSKEKRMTLVNFGD